MLDATVPIGPDGTVKIAIDTALAKTLHGNSDHRYEITAEVVDQSRRTIVGSGEVLVARKPFQVFAWTDRGYYQAGDAIQRHVPGSDARSEAGQRQGSRHAVPRDLRRRWQADRNGRANLERRCRRAGAGPARNQGVPGRAISALVQADRREESDDRRGPRLHGARRRVRRVSNSASTTWNSSPTSASTRRARKSGCSINTNRLDSTVLLFVRPVVERLSEAAGPAAQGQEHAGRDRRRRRRTCRTFLSRR